MSSLRVHLLCQFGMPVRGISPYADSLLAGLSKVPGLEVKSVDYKAAFPGALHPGGAVKSAVPGELHWANPLTWRQVASAEGSLLHIQHWLSPMAVYLWPVARMAKRQGKAVLVTVHNPRAHESMSWAEPFEERLFANVNALLVHDERGKRALESRLRNIDVPVYVIPHGVNASHLKNSSRQDDCNLLKLDPSRRYVCLFGNLRKYKGVDVLLQAWAQVLTRVPDVDLVVAGRLWEGSKSLASHLAARLLGTDVEARRVRNAMKNPALTGRTSFWQGFLDDAVIDALLRVSEFSVFPYVRFSSQSGAACRAAGLGCPLLVSDVGGLADLAITPDWIVPPGDPDALASRMTRLLNISSGNVSRKAQLEHVAPYSWEHVAGQHADLYKSLCAQPQILE